MSPERLTAIAALVDAAAWPAVFLTALLIFVRPLRALLLRDDVELTGPAGLGLTAKRRAAAVDALALAEQSKGSATSKSVLDQEVRDAARVVSKFPRAPRVLWVDDRPSNNRYEKAALEALGLSVDLSTATDEALAMLRRRNGHYDLVITDMGRPGDARAGYTLLDTMRREGDETPLVIYAASRRPEHFDEAVRHGALGCTDRPQELIDMVLRGLLDGARHDSSSK